MKALITILIALAVFWVSKRIYFTYEKAEKESGTSERAVDATQAPASSAPAPLPGVPASLEASLSAAEKRGAPGLREWLNTYRIYAHDPRLASIELDYVVLIIQKDPAEAKRIFKEVQERTPISSPVYERIKRLQSTFQ